MRTISNRRVAVAAGLLGLLAATGAGAAAFSFTDNLSGTDLGTTTIATLDATQGLNGVDFVLTHRLAGHDGSFVKDLNLSYGGTLQPVSAFTTAGVAFGAFDKHGFIDSGHAYSMQISFPTTNRLGGLFRLEYGETSRFTLLGTILTGFNFGTGGAMLHMNGLNDGSSTKYGPYVPPPDANPVPVPAAGLLLATALGFGVIHRLARRGSA